MSNSVKENILILIPPSEGKSDSGQFPPLKKVSKEVAGILELMDKVKSEQWPKILGVKDKALAAAKESNQNILTSKTLPAIERYTGVVYNAIDYEHLSKSAQKYFNDHVGIISAVFGLVKPNECIPNYKLKIDKLGADRYWKPIIQKELKERYIIDLLPKAHQKAVHYDEGQSINFFIMKKGKRAPAGHQGKYIKGRFIRYICESKCADINTIKKFDEDGFKYVDGNFVKEVLD